MLEGLASLMLMVTYECPLRCSYCQVRRRGRGMPLATGFAAVDYLLQSRKPRLQLRFFGGEPLLRFDFMREVMRYGESRRQSRPLHYFITTNGLLLDDEKLRFLQSLDATVLLSLDGSREGCAARLKGAGRDCYAILLRALDCLQGSGVTYFVNLVIAPPNAANIRRELQALAALGVRRAQLAYQVGLLWPREALESLKTELGVFMRRPCLELLNYANGSEPVMLSDEIIVDDDAAIYLDAAIFIEQAFPKLRGSHRLGRLGAAPALDLLRFDRRELFERFRAAYPPETRGGKILLNNIAVGLELRRFFERTTKVASA